MSRKPWWGRVRDDAPGAPLHRMIDVPDHVFRETLCGKERGNGYAKSASPWSGEERCPDCVFLTACAREEM